MKRLRRKLNQKGFSLAEMLMAILILLMVSVIVATGMPAARNAYEKVVVGANAQAMLSTAVAALRDELGTAWDVRVNDSPALTTGTFVTYFKADTGTRAKIALESGKTITLQDFVTVDFIHDTSEEALDNAHHLVPDANTDLYATYSGIDYNKTTGIVTIKGLKVCKAKDDTTVAELGKGAGNSAINLEIKVLSGGAS